MATIVTRSGKGSALTHTEMDANFNNLNAGLVDDLTPQLGGNLDLNGKNITGTGAIPSANLSGALPAIDGSALTNLSAGKVLQVVSVTKTDTFSTTSTTFTDITGFSVSITPSATNSKILAVFSTNVSNNNSTFIRLVRGSTAICVPTTAGSRQLASISTTANGSGNALDTNSNNYLDSPATTSATTYKLQMSCQGSTGYLNRSWSDIDSNLYPRGVSTLTLMEIGA